MRAPERRPRTRFAQDFGAFLAALKFKLKDFLPADEALERFPEHQIPRTTGYEKLRGEGRLTGERAILWSKRAQCFLDLAISKGRSPLLDGFAFVQHVNGHLRVDWRKLMALYNEDAEVAVQIKFDRSIDSAIAAEIYESLKQIVQNKQAGIAKVAEGCIEITVRVSVRDVDRIIAAASAGGVPPGVMSVRETELPAASRVRQRLIGDDLVIDFGSAGAFDQFRKVWLAQRRIELVLRPWRRLWWLASPSVKTSPIAGVIRESGERAYAADHRGEARALLADIVMSCLTWPIFAAATLALLLLALQPSFPDIAIGAGVATGLAVALVGAQVCATALSPIACGAGTVVLCWAFGLAQAFAIGTSQFPHSLNRASVQSDLFISVTGGILGLSAPDWLSRFSIATITSLVVIIALAIAAAGWFMAQPAKAGAVVVHSRRRSIFGALAGAMMGAGIGLVQLATVMLHRAGMANHDAFIVAFVVIGGTVFAVSIKLQWPEIQRLRWLAFVLAHAVIASLLFSTSFHEAGTGLGMLALAAASGWYHSTWFTAASVVGNRIGAAHAAVVATTLEGAIGFSGFIVARVLGG